MQAGYKLTDGGRVDVETDKSARRVRVEIEREDEHAKFTLTLSEARAISSALMGAAAEA